jgi:hypothetical protein
VRALFGTTEVAWSRIAELAPDERRRVSALLDNGNVIRLTGVTTANLPAVLAAAGQETAPAAGTEAAEQADSEDAEPQ